MAGPAPTSGIGVSSGRLPPYTASEEEEEEEKEGEEEEK